jgi:adenylate cyclase class IV
VIRQEDFFFHCSNGRLKLRVLSPSAGELIFYQRPDAPGPKTSRYWVSRTAEPSALLDVLTRSHGVRAVVRKTRRLFVVDRTRIHLDSVDELGHFLELEVMLNDSEGASAGEASARSLMMTLGVDDSALVAGAYVDLLVEKDGQRSAAAGARSASATEP